MQSDQNKHPGNFSHNRACEPVKLNLIILKQGVRKLKFKPNADIFATDTTSTSQMLLQTPRSQLYYPTTLLKTSRARVLKQRIDWNL